jgi:hypothetical protein
MDREREAYPYYLGRLLEEMGDFLWYLVRLLTVRLGSAEAIQSLPNASQKERKDGVALAIDLAQATNELVQMVAKGEDKSVLASAGKIWELLLRIATLHGIKLESVADQNVQKTQSRWAAKKTYTRLFDEDFPKEEQLPRKFSVVFIERVRGSRVEVLLRYGDVNIGDRLTDNMHDADDYRFHDVFHFAHAAILGWSPVVRSILRCKRKSNSDIDENQDGARAIVVEEAIAAAVFGRAKNMKFYEGLQQVDFDLLKQIKELVSGFEVEHLPMWQWEVAILEGYRVFRQLRASRGGEVTWDLGARSLEWRPPA